MGNEEAKRAILRRRAQFIALALASAGVAATGAEACGGNTSSDESNHHGDAAPQPCLEPPLDDASIPQPCLGRPLPEDSGVDVENQTDAGDAAIEDAEPEDAAPRPCLAPPP